MTKTLLELGALDPLLAKDSWPWRALSDRGTSRLFTLALRRVILVQAIDGVYAVYTPPAPFDDDPEGDWATLAHMAPRGLAGVIGNDRQPLYRAILDAAGRASRASNAAPAEPWTGWRGAVCWPVLD